MIYICGQVLGAQSETRGRDMGEAGAIGREREPTSI